jgi:hypothetical protein
MKLKDLLCRDYAAVAELAEKMAPQCVGKPSEQRRWLRIAAHYRNLAVELATDDGRADLQDPIEYHAFMRR